MKPRLCFFVLGLILCISGCGRSGPLYLPEQAAQNQAISEADSGEQPDPNSESGK